MTAAEKLVKVLAEKKMTCATAESCTGGGVGYTITGVSGSSAVFWGGVISYDNSVKSDVLGVPEEVLATKGAVSSECAAAMAEGARRLLKTDLAVSLTGIAGPGGGTKEKPVGLIFLGFALRGCEKVDIVKLEDNGAHRNRDENRFHAAEAALHGIMQKAADYQNQSTGKE